MFFKKKKENKTVQQPQIDLKQEDKKNDNNAVKKGFFSKLKKGLSKTANKLTGSLNTILLGQKFIDEDLLDDIEMQLLTSDIGVDATREIIDDLRNKVSCNEIQTVEALNSIIKKKLTNILNKCNDDFDIKCQNNPFVLLVVGVNGVGKTTTIGKLAKKFQMQGKSVMLAAGDTFRAAAVEQLQEWGYRNRVPVVAQHTGSDSASVIFDAVQSAQSKGIDIVIADTAGRLHTKDNLMEELKKVARVIKKLDTTAPHEIMIVIDAGTGQNAISQAEAFNATIPLTGVTITKLDGTAKGGVVFAIAKALNLPIRFIGVGEGIDDLQRFNASDFIDALFTQDI